MKHPERDLQKVIVTWLRFQKPNCVWFHVPNGGARTKKTGAMLKAMGALAGVADLCFVMPGGTVGFIELKAGKGTLEDTQIAFREAVQEKDAKWAEARSLEDVKRLMKEWGVL